jgi:hypothetical protein
MNLANLAANKNFPLKNLWFNFDNVQNMAN